MIKKITVIFTVTVLLLTGSLYKAQKTEAFAIPLTGIAITALIMAGIGILGYNAVSEADLSGMYDGLDSGTKTLIGEITVDQSADGDALKLQHSQIGTIASLVIQNVYNKFSKAFRYDNYDNPVSTSFKNSQRYIALGFVPAFTETLYTSVNYTYYGIIANAFKFAYYVQSSKQKYIRVPSDSAQGSFSVSLGQEIPQHALTMAFLPASLFGYAYDDKIAVSIVTTNGIAFPTDLTNVVYLADDTIAVPWGTAGVPMLETTVKPLVDGIPVNTTDIDTQSITLTDGLPVIGDWSPGMELDPPTAQDIANTQLEGLGDDLIFLGAGTIVAGEWENITKDLVNPDLELDPTMPWDRWEDITFPVIDESVISGDTSIPTTDGVAYENPWEGWLLGGLAGIGALLKNLGAWLLEGLMAALASVFGLLKFGFEGVKALLGDITGILSNILAAIGALAVSIYTPITNWLSDIWDTMKDLPNFFEMIYNVAKFFLRLFQYMFNLVIALFQIITVTLFGSIINSIDTVLTSIKNIFSVLPDPLDEISYRIINIASFTAFLTLILKILRIRKA